MVMLASTIAMGLLATRLGPWGWEPSPIVGGEPVVGDEWRSTVVLDLGVDLCSGTLISERVVLTAAHCLQSMPPAELLQVKLGNTRADPELSLPVERYALHPEYCANVFECEEDLLDFAYVVLAEAAPADAVVPHFQRWWKVWSSEHLATHPLVATLDERVAAGGHAKQEACDVLAEHIAERAPAGSPARLFGDPAALRGRSSRCWWLHHDGMMGPGLGAALASDGTVLVVWIVSEG